MRFAALPRRFVGVCLATLIAVALGTASLPGTCGPFTDVAGDAFCAFVLEIFYAGITTGVTPTTYDPAGNVSRLQMAAFLSRTVEGTIKRASRRAALGQFWRGNGTLGLTPLGKTDVANAALVRSDGTDVWVSSAASELVRRVRGSDGSLLGTWTGATAAHDLLVAMGQVFVAGGTAPGKLYWIEPTSPPLSVTTLVTNLGNQPFGLAFDGIRIWSANEGSVSIVVPTPSFPWTATTVSAGFVRPAGMIFDGSNVWTTDFLAARMLKLDSAGAILQTVTVGSSPWFPVFDGANIWVPNSGTGSVTVVRASNGVILATLTGNGLADPLVGAFDGERILVTSQDADTVSLWKAADLTAIGSFSTGGFSGPYGACSDGIHFWIALNGTNKVARF